MDKQRDQRARQARAEAAARARRKQAVRKYALIGGGALLAVAAVATVLVNRAADADEQERLEAIFDAGGCTYDTETDGGSEHIPDPSYDLDPPAGGDHTPQAASAGIFAPGSVPPDGPLVHAMEHGFVVLWYRSDIDGAVVEELMDVAAEDRNATLVVPRESLDVPVAATAWHRRLLCREFEAEPLSAFVAAYRDKGPEKGFVAARQ